MASIRLALSALFVLLATAVVNADIINCVSYGLNVTVAVPGTTGTVVMETCLICDVGFTLTTSNYSCTACPTRCATCNLNRTCNSCITGYNITNGTCPDCGTGCSRCGVNGCEVCASGFYIHDGGCIACSRFCATCTSDRNCTTCIHDYDRYVWDGAWYCRPEEDRRNAWWTFLVVAGILALLIFALCCYLSMLRGPAPNASYAVLSTSTPAYQMTTTQTKTLVPTTPVVGTPGPTIIQPAVGAKTNYYGGF